MFLDIAMGILIPVGISWFLQTNLTHFFVWSGIIFALLPDADAVIEYIKHGSVGGKVIREHRELIHFPLLYTPIAFIIFVMASGMWAALFGIAILVHFTHDSVGYGWGIQWLWPFSKRYYKFFAEKDGTWSSRFLISWSRKELQEAMAIHGDPNWIKNLYLPRYFPFELLSLIFALATLNVYWR